MSGIFTKMSRSTKPRSFSVVLFFILISFCSSSVSAQESGQLPAANTELGRENLVHVAASPQEIKLLLLKDSGLMIKVKQWIARDATANGQLVSDSDLTDDAIFDRLQSDVPFRSSITLLLQRYGHFQPKLNPESDAAKERELILQERARMLAEAHRDDLATGRGSLATRSSTNSCDAQRDDQCRAAAQPSSDRQLRPADPSRGTTRYQESPYLAPQPRSTRPPDLETADYPSDSTITIAPLGGREEAYQALNNAELLQTHAGSLVQQTGRDQFPEILPTANNAGRDTVDTFAIYGIGANRKETTSAGSAFKSDSAIGPLRESSAVIPPSDSIESRNHLANSATLSTPELFRAPNPYREIPSLYDMYVQAAPRPVTPARFGFEVFASGARDSHLIPMDLSVGPDYVVGPGDALSIDLWGGITQRLYRVVDHGGRISLPDVGPLLVSGKSLATVQQELQQLLRTEFRDLSADVSLSRTRTIRVYEVGEIANPGAYDVTSLSTPLNAMFAAGGPTSGGSLRFIKHVRGGKLLEVVDLYDLLLNGVRPDLQRLENGDTILVPPVGPQVTVEGMVRRPAIYELKNENLASVLELAGGLLPTASLRHIEVQRVVAHEKQTMLSVELQDSDNELEITRKIASFQVHDGDRIRVFAIPTYNQDVIFLAGHVSRPGRYSFHSEMRVTDVITSYKDLLPEPAGQHAEIIRLNAPDFHPSVEGFNLADALANPSQAPVLHPMDTIRVFGRFDFENPPTVSVWGEVRVPGTYRTAGQIRLNDALFLAGGLAPSAMKADAQVVRELPDGKTKVFSVDLNLALAGDPKANILLQPRDQLLIHANTASLQPPTVYIQGEVGRPGRYPLTFDMTVSDLIQISGGLKAGANRNVADLTTYKWSDQGNLNGNRQTIQIASALIGDPSSNPKLSNGDVLTIRQLPGWNDLGATISVKGQVQSPGAYGIRPGEHLSSILERAGGFQSDAYVYGAILQRAQVRELETQQQTAMILRIKDMETNLQLLPENDARQKQAKASALQQYQSTLSELSATPPLGRVTIHISADISRWKGTPMDVEVRAGDTLLIPKRPSFVMVSGQVFNATAVGFRPGKSGNWYLSQSGGPTTLADKKGIFVIRADGSVIGGRESAWSGPSLGEVLQPGDTIVVPEKAVGGSVQWQNVFLAAQVAASVASTAILALKL
jgi:protein involved in polysaccharide export with SLBB domain